MSVVRANFSRFTQDAEFDLLGKNLVNWGAQSSVTAPHRGGGFLYMSFASQLEGAGFLQFSSYDIMASTYGLTQVSNVWSSGFRWVPLMAVDLSNGDGASSIWLPGAPTGTQALTGATSVGVIRFSKASQTVGSGIVPTSASTISIHCFIIGLIVSAPDTNL